MTQPKRVDSQTLFISSLQQVQYQNSVSRQKSVIFFLHMGPNLILAMEMNKSRIQDLQDPTKLFCLNINIEIFQKKGFMQDALPDYRLEITLGPMLPSRSFRPDTPRKNCKNIINKGMLNHVPRRTHCFVVQKTKTLSIGSQGFQGFSWVFHKDLTNSSDQSGQGTGQAGQAPGTQRSCSNRFQELLVTNPKQKHELQSMAISGS